MAQPALQDSKKTQDVQTRVAVVVDGLVARRKPAAVPVGPTDILSEVGLTSLDMVNLMLGIEEEFDIFVPQKQMVPDNFRTISAIVALLDGLLT